MRLVWASARRSGRPAAAAIQSCISSHVRAQDAGLSRSAIMTFPWETLRSVGPRWDQKRSTDVATVAQPSIERTALASGLPLMALMPW